VGHVTGLPLAQAPAWHVSACVQPLPSLHEVPFGATGLEQVPVDGLQVPARWHESDGAHVTGLPLTQAPAWHASPCVQPSPSVHEVPLGAAGLEQAPVDGLHVPATWH
jgi:hypothetical protein